MISLNLAKMVNYCSYTLNSNYDKDVIIRTFVSHTVLVIWTVDLLILL